MYSIAEKLPPELQFVLLLATLLGILGLSIVGILVWGRVRRMQIEADVKTDMLERGLSVQEIRDVLSAPMRGRQRHEVQAELSAKLAEMGLDGEQIKRVLEAGRPYWAANSPKGCR